jgi:hypothetical protein
MQIKFSIVLVVFISIGVLACKEDLVKKNNCRLIEYRKSGSFWWGNQHIQINFFYKDDKLGKIVALECEDAACLTIRNKRKYVYEYSGVEIENVTLYDNDSIAADKQFIFEDNKLVRLDMGSYFPPNSYDLFFYNDQGYVEKRELWRSGILERFYIPHFENGNLVGGEWFARNVAGRDTIYFRTTESVISYAENDKFNPLKGCLPLYDIYGSHAFITNENTMIHHELYEYNSDGDLTNLIGTNFFHEYNDLGYPVFTFFSDNKGKNSEMYYEYECY